MNDLRQRPQLTKQTADLIREHHVIKLRAGDQLPPVRDLATELGVSIPTIRAAQSLLAKDKYVEIRHGSGVYVAGGPTERWIGIFSEMDLCAPRASSYFRVLSSKLRLRLINELGVNAEIYIGHCQVDEDQPAPSCRRLLADLNADVLSALVITNALETEHWRNFAAGLRIPAIGALTEYRSGISQQRLMEAGIEALQQQGCRKVAMLSWGVGALPFYEEVSRRGMSTHPQWVCNDLHPQQVGAGWKEFRAIWNALPDKPDGLLITDDLLASEAAIAIVELGIEVPTQLKVVSHSNLDSEITLPFCSTRLIVNPDEVAQAYTAMIADILNHGKPSRQTIEVPFAIEQIEPHRTAMPQLREPSEASIETNAVLQT